MGYNGIDYRGTAGYGHWLWALLSLGASEDSLGFLEIEKRDSTPLNVLSLDENRVVSKLIPCLGRGYPPILGRDGVGKIIRGFLDAMNILRDFS